MKSWCAAYQQTVKEVMDQRIYRLTRVGKPSFAPGALREVTIGEAKLVYSWCSAFQSEALGGDPSPARRERIREWILQGSALLWEDCVPVSMAVSTRPTRNGISIGAVYTPPEHRNHGYATSCVASLWEKLLREYQFCVLYTDLLNRVSNSIYKRIGFRKYCGSAEYSYDHEKA